MKAGTLTPITNTFEKQKNVWDLNTGHVCYSDPNCIGDKSFFFALLDACELQMVK
jgi:hypothetical protein